MHIKFFVSRKLKSLKRDFSVYNHIYLSRLALLNNFDLLREYSPGGLVIPVLKSNAYGHGLEQVTEILKVREFPYIAVDGYFEALQIRKISSQPVLIMGAIDPINYSRIRPKNFAFVVHDLETIYAMGESQKSFTVHIEIETGMNRHGIKIENLPSFINIIKKYKNIKVEGAMSHLADADNPTDESFVRKQSEVFDKSIEILANFGIHPKFIHIAQSAGCTKSKSKYANTIRIGLALYGIPPLFGKDRYFDKYQDLRPVLSLNSTITKIINVKPGESVSYSRTYKPNHKTTIGIIPFGYYEGLPRSLSNIGIVKTNNTYLKIVGRICMNHTFIEIKNAKIVVGDNINIISDNPSDKNSLINLCKKYDLFNYEILARLNQNIRRTIID